MWRIHPYDGAVDPRKIDMRLLNTLEAVHRAGSLTAAGQELGLSQPAVSHALRRLRTVFKDPLFVRAPSGMTPTPRAVQLAASARRIQATMRAELEGLDRFEPAALERVIRLCATDAGEMVVLPKLLQRLRVEAPGVDVQTLTTPPRTMVEALDSGVADLAVGPFPELARSSLRRQRLYRRGFLCITSQDHPRLRHGGLTVQTFLSEPHLVVRSPGRTEEVFEHFLAENGFARRVALTVPHTLCVPTVIRATDLVATVPQSVGLGYGDYPGLRVSPVPFHGPISPPVTTVSQYWSHRFDADPVNLWLRATVAELFLEQDVAREQPDRGEPARAGA